ncbi:MAG: cytochrome c [Chloroflexi bacterium]|nr:cytochrome c [Chloroflexota bacterium]MCY4246816.1 cytochrome c [Chloroflexota bacterium]
MRSRPLIWLTMALSLLLLSGCSADAPGTAFAELDLSRADADSGAKLFQQSINAAPACAACHSITGENSALGNSLAGLAGAAGSRVAGQSAAEYLYWSIVQPGRALVAGYSNIMYAGYADSLEAADLADLVAYLLTLS